MESFARPDPEAGSDANDEGHEILDHIDSKVWSHAWGVLHRAGDGEAFTVLAHPAPLPVLSEGLLVEVARDDNGGRYGVKNTEDPNPDHQPLQLLRLRAVVFHDGPDSEEGDKTSEEKGGSDEEVDKEGGQHKSPERVNAIESYEANSTQKVSIDLPHG